MPLGASQHLPRSSCYYVNKRWQLLTCVTTLLFVPSRGVYKVLSLWRNLSECPKEDRNRVFLDALEPFGHSGGDQHGVR